MTIKHIYVEPNVLELEIRKDTGRADLGSGFTGVEHKIANDGSNLWILEGTGCWIKKIDNGNYYLVRGDGAINNVIYLRLSEEEFRKIRSKFQDAGHDFPEPIEK